MRKKFPNPKMTMTGCVFGNAGEAAIYIEDPNLELDISGTKFVDNAQDIVAPNGLRKLGVANSAFGTKETIPLDQNKVKGYVQGWSFEKNGKPK